MLEIAVTREPDPQRFEQLLRERLPALYPELTKPPRTLFQSGISLCLLVEPQAHTVLIAADPASATAALTAALQCIETRAPDTTRVVLLCPDAPPGLDWLNRQGNIQWVRCEVLTVNGEPGLLLEQPQGDIYAAQQVPPATLQPVPPSPTVNPGLTDEEQLFFSHL